MYLGKHQIQILEKDSQAKSWSGWFAKSPSKGPLATWICMMWLPKLGFARTWAQGVLGWQFDDPIDTSCTSDAMLWWFSFRIPSWFIRGDHGWDVRLSECCNLAKKRPRKGSRKHLQTFTTKKRFRNDQNIYIYIPRSRCVFFSFPAKTSLGFWCFWCLSKYDSDLKFMYSKNTSRYNNHLIDSSTGTIFVNDAKNRGNVWSGMVARFLVSSANCSSCSCLQISGT